MRICFTGGGTLGHVYPALSVAERLGDEECFFISSRKDDEISVIRNAGIECIPISGGKLRRYFSLKNISDVFRIAAGFFQSVGILKKKRPDVLFSKGGFISVPPVIAAHMLHIPVLTHESDFTPGLATRINSRYADKVLCGFESCLEYFDNAEFVGNPVRRALLDDSQVDVRRKYSIPSDMPVLLVLGGSQGALEVNELIWKSLDVLCSHFFVIHQCGDLTYREIEHDNYLAFRTIREDLGGFYREATLCVTRGGANTLNELACFSLVPVIVPLRNNASRGEQVLNAEYLRDRGAALLFENDGSSDLSGMCISLLDDDKRNKMESALSSLCIRDSADRIADIIRGEKI